MADVIFNRLFNHRDWIDNEDVVQAEGENGFNVRFHAIEDELDLVSAAFAVADSEIKKIQRLQFLNAVAGVNLAAATVSQEFEVEVRTDDIRDDYNVRNVGTVKSTRIAYVVTSDDGVQLTLCDGRQVLIGSKDPQALHEAISAARRAAGQGKP